MLIQAKRLRLPGPSAGPGGATPGKPVGLFYIGLSHKEKAFSREHIFHGDREENKQLAAMAALNWLIEYLIGLPD